MRELNIRIAGAAGQGMATATELLGRAVTRCGLFAYSYNDAESRIRGGLNFSHVRIADRRLCGVTNRTEVLIALTKDALGEFGDGIGDGNVITAAPEWEHPKRAPFALAGLAQEAGSLKAMSTVAYAVIAGLAGLEREIAMGAVRDAFGGNDKLLEINLKAFELGYKAGADLEAGKRCRMPAGDGKSGRMWLSGGDAISLGAVAGGVTFVAAYPMSPATSIMTNLAQWGLEAGVVVEQAEDEVAAINYVAGASYAGARAMTATSGGGFALMVEGLSNIGMIEVPAVIVLAQRPGPATGLPTRTAQGELNFVRHAGHGSFARVILAPKNVPDCFDVTARAFDTAEKYQVPVIILTDQLLQDSFATVEPFVTDGLPGERYCITADALNAMEHYQRYAQTDTGISPIAAPGISKHTVIVDSDEHNEDGHMIEAAGIAERMAAKRLRKAATVAREIAREPEIYGNRAGNPLLVSWGSSFETVYEAWVRLGEEGVPLGMMHMRTMWPVDGSAIRRIFDESSRVIAIDNSAGCEIDALLRETALRGADGKITRLDGRPFDVEWLVGRIKEEVSR